MLPLFIWVTGAVLFAAFAFFAFAQAAVARNSGQSAADASALAAAQQARADLVRVLGQRVADGEDWRDLLENPQITGAPDLSDAAALAGRNGAHLRGPVTVGSVRGLPAFTAKIEMNSSIGRTVIPGVGAEHAKSSATAVIAPRCEAEQAEEDDFEVSCAGSLFQLSGRDFDPAELPDDSKLFSVYLSD
ncbi:MULTISPECIES: hypothetical protein [Streptomyces]|uniref:Flp pilus-assembly TadG-like N-terminal domain-containing protein n=1 Tax=Streptomyces evansiae TaxID=3075535 RepID=A0ABU2R802_9ACTN|nr:MULTISPECIES: hypothetical protein [unclassified Streptomyces]MDT0412826.1 hypothetical protein [Streptomyces sp. DSM 41979]MYQ59513.1 hypothetical protein [Streptomyces sp. SID4926]SCE45878.1 hypothetical protein GA0115252_15094 [Streptomyces sp. DfronAA-171]